MRITCHILTILFCFSASSVMTAQSGLKHQNISSFVEYGASVHTGDNTPLWQVSNQHGLSSIDNNTYLRGGAFYTDTIRQWRLEGGLDMAVASGFTSTFILQQAYADIRYKWLGILIGSKEIDSPLLNQQLSSGGLIWSGNARPIPQVWIGLPEYVQVLPRLALKAEMSYGWFTDNKYQRKQVGEDYWYTKSIKYHHKSGFLRIGVPQGNFMGSEHIRMTYRHEDFSISAYLENYYDDFSGMGKLNGFDGLWGIEYKSNHKQAINGFVLEYYQTTNQSGPMHGVDFTVVEKTGGADDYYNNEWYPGWVHWGMTMANPLIASPIYNKDGDMSFKYNRIRALHLGWSGDISNEWTYLAKLSYNKTWGTPFKPIPNILENFSTFASVFYTPHKWKGWRFNASIAFDIGEIYGDNLGCQLKVQKTF